MSISNRLEKIKKEIRETAQRCGRDPDEITLVAVSKGHSPDKIAAAYEAGCRDFGESRVQEMLEKMAKLPHDIRWHFIGTLQKNKVNKIKDKCHLIHSVDSFELARKLASAHTGRQENLLLEVNISGEFSKHGFNPSVLKDFLCEMLEWTAVQFRGLMAIAPLEAGQEEIRSCFRQLRELRDELQLLVKNQASLNELSMGMSHDFPLAIQEGATLLRIGTAIFGERSDAT